MPSQRYDGRYEATRGDVLAAVGPQSPNPLSGPDDPDPFGVNERPWTEYLIVSRIVEINRVPVPGGVHLGRAIKRNKLRELLAEMVADGTIIGRPRKEWAAMKRESPTRMRDILYAHPALAHRWMQEDSVPRETSEPEHEHRYDNTLATWSSGPDYGETDELKACACGAQITVSADDTECST